MKLLKLTSVILATSLVANAQTRKLDAGVTDSPEGLKLATSKKKNQIAMMIYLRVIPVHKELYL